MPAISFDALPDASRLWIFHSAVPFTPAQRGALERGLGAILAQWQSHGSPVTGGFTLRYDRFVLVGGDETREPLAGCSMDGLRDQVVQLGHTLGLELLDGPPVIWREGPAIVSGTRPDFKARIAAGAITPESRVFDLTLQTLGELRAGRWERPFHESWHAKAFRLPAASVAAPRAI